MSGSPLDSNPPVPPGCTPEMWERTLAAARAGEVCKSAEEALWRGFADGIARGDQIPEHKVARLAALHRPYLLPDAGEDSSAA
jgi:hypothetical protein